MKLNNSVRLQDGRKLGYAEYGNHTGQPILYFHGWPGSRVLPKKVDKTAKKLGLRLIAVDRPGFGLSDFKKDRQLLDWPKDIVELTESLGLKKFAVIGLSGGAPYAAVCAYKIPEKISKTGIVVGLGPTHFKGAFHGVRFINKFGRKGYSRSQLLARFTTAILIAESKLIAKRLPITYFAREERKKYLEELKKEWAVHRNQSFRQGAKGPALDLKIYANDWGFDLSEIKIPVLLWYGGQDRYVSLNMGRYFVSQIRNSKLTIYADDDHLGVFNNHNEEILKNLTS